jgi:hypothetical protein
MKPVSPIPSILASNVDSSPMTSVCRKLSDFTEKVEQETKQLDHILKALRDYYTSIKTK